MFRLKSLNSFIITFPLALRTKRINAQKMKASKLGKPSVVLIFSIFQIYLLI